MAGRRSRWVPGTVYAVPLEDGSFGFAQAIDAMMVNVIYVVLFADHVSDFPMDPPPLERRRVVSLAATQRQQLNGGEWLRIGVVPPIAHKAEFPNERFARNGYVGATHYDAGVLADFLSAYHGLLPWNVMHEEDYNDRLLAPGVRRPVSARVLDATSRAAYRKAHA